MYWIVVALGLSDPSSWEYLLWSGFFTNAPLLAVGYIFYSHKKCVSCHRIAMHRVEGTAWATCHKHMTTEQHDNLLAEYTVKFPEQAKLLAGDRADSENLIQP